MLRYVSSCRWEYVTRYWNVGRRRRWKPFAVILLQFIEWNRDNETPLYNVLWDGHYQTGCWLRRGTDHAGREVGI